MIELINLPKETEEQEEHSEDCRCDDCREKRAGYREYVRESYD